MGGGETYMTFVYCHFKLFALEAYVVRERLYAYMLIHIFQHQYVCLPGQANQMFVRYSGLYSIFSPSITILSLDLMLVCDLWRSKSVSGKIEQKNVICPNSSSKM